MKQHASRVVLMLMLSVGASQAMAGQTPWTTVMEIRQGPASSPLVRLGDLGAVATECSSKTSVKIPDADSDTGKRHFSTLLTALTSGLRVSIITSGTCVSNWALIEEVLITR